MRHLAYPRPAIQHLGYPFVSAADFYILRDNFLTDDPAPLVIPAPAEPGPGTRDAAWVTVQPYILSGEMVFPASNEGARPALAYDILQSRRVGLAYTVSFRQAVAGELAINCAMGAGGSFNESGCGWRITVGNIQFVTLATPPGISNVATPVNVPAAGTPFRVWSVMRSTGSFWIVSESPYTVHKIARIDDLSTHAANRITITQRNFTTSTVDRFIDNVHVVDLPAKGYSIWGDDFGIITERHAGAVSAGQTFTHVADAWIHWRGITRPSAGSINVRFRVQDANNYWEGRITAAGDFELWEIVATVPTLRATAGVGVVVNGSRIRICLDTAKIWVFVDEGSFISYTTATNFQTATSGSVASLGTGGAITDLEIWPFVITDAAAIAGLDDMISHA